MGTPSGPGCVEGSGSSDTPRTLRPARDGRGFSYDSGDDVSDVSRKWTLLDLTPEEIGGRETLVCPGGGCIVWRAVVVVVEENGELRVCTAQCQSYIRLWGTLPTSSRHQTQSVEICVPVW